MIAGGIGLPGIMPPADALRDTGAGAVVMIVVAGTCVVTITDVAADVVAVVVMPTVAAASARRSSGDFMSGAAATDTNTRAGESACVVLVTTTAGVDLGDAADAVTTVPVVAFRVRLATAVVGVPIPASASPNGMPETPVMSGDSLAIEVALAEADTDALAPALLVAVCWAPNMLTAVCGTLTDCSAPFWAPVCFFAAPLDVDAADFKRTAIAGSFPSGLGTKGMGMEYCLIGKSKRDLLARAK